VRRRWCRLGSGQWLGPEGAEEEAVGWRLSCGRGCRAEEDDGRENSHGGRRVSGTLMKRKTQVCALTLTTGRVLGRPFYRSVDARFTHEQMGVWTVSWC
jgi:hypothetical protein